MFCQKCGTEIPQGTNACPKCGARLSAASPDAVKRIATITQRLCNHLIDTLGLMVLGFIVGVLCGILGVVTGNKSFSSIIVTVASVLVTPAYYVFFEGIWGRTPGKWATGTKVVTREGVKPGFWRTFGRSFARIIPFEPLSYLFSTNPYGWHDSLSKTMVVSAEYAPEDIRAIDPKNKAPGSAAGVVIAIIAGVFFVVIIIGILSSVVLAALNTARAKGTDAAIRSALTSARAQAEIYYDVHGSSYQGLCEDETVAGLLSPISGSSKFDYTCNDSKNAWAISYPLRTAGFACVDSTGALGTANRGLGAAQVACAAEEAAQAPVTVNWSTYTSNKDRFSVLFPSNPHIERETNIPVDGSAMTYDVASYDASDNANTFVVVRYAYSEDLPESKADDIMKYFLDSYVGSKGAKLIASSFTSRKGEKALDYTARVGDEMIKGAYIYKGNSVYWIAMDYFPDSYDSNLYQKFIQSFDIL